MTQPAAQRLLPALLAALLLPGVADGATRTYTLDADFALGVLSGVNFTAVANQLQLNTVGTTFPVMWIANAGEDTVSKFDTVANREIARYRTWFGPAGQTGHVSHLNDAYAGPAPSRTAVDLDGNAYVLNRWFANQFPVLLKILTEGGIDRNGNGVIDTSIDTDANGVITGAEILNMTDSNGNGIIDPSEILDERIAWAVRVGSQNGLGRALCIGTDGHLWVGMYNAFTYYKVSSVDGSQLAGPVSTAPTAGMPNAGSWRPYGCLIDENGTLWSASLGSILGKIENTHTAGPYPVSSFNGGSTNYGIALGNNMVYLGLANRKFDPSANTFAASGHTVGTAGIVVDGSGNIIAGQSTVQKRAPDGSAIWQAPLQAGGSSSVGIQVDSNNDVWQIGFVSAGRMQKYAGATGAPLGTFPVGNMPYTYSDAAGFAARNVTTLTGTWTVIFDGATNGTGWANVAWNDLVPAGAAVAVRVRAADTQAALPLQSYQAVANGAAIAGVTGRYIQIETRLTANQADVSPILFDLTVNSLVTGCDVDLDGDVDRNDIGLIMAGIGTPPAPNDPRDPTADGRITINDVRFCTLRCTRANCAL